MVCKLLHKLCKLEVEDILIVSSGHVGDVDDFRSMIKELLINHDKKFNNCNDQDFVFHAYDQNQHIYKLYRFHEFNS